ncbi:MAG: hypothetical protein U9R08_02880 [Nanoarchaeota archaeon]|nr:hypothetical protein [Nanoarchaeota archaeon]
MKNKIGKILAILGISAGAIFGGAKYDDAQDQKFWNCAKEGNLCVNIFNQGEYIKLRTAMVQDRDNKKLGIGMRRTLYYKIVNKEIGHLKIKPVGPITRQEFLDQIHELLKLKINNKL